MRASPSVYACAVSRRLLKLVMQSQATKRVHDVETGMFQMKVVACDKAITLAQQAARALDAAEAQQCLAEI